MKFFIQTVIVIVGFITLQANDELNDPKLPPSEKDYQWVQWDTVLNPSHNNFWPPYEKYWSVVDRFGIRGWQIQCNYLNGEGKEFTNVPADLNTHCQINMPELYPDWVTDNKRRAELIPYGYGSWVACLCER